VPRLYLLRHGLPSDAEIDPPLSPDGERLMERQAAGLARLGVAFDVIAASPLRRASRTAEIVAAGTGFAGEVAIAESIAASLSVETLADLLEPLRLEAPRFDHVLIVGHAPALGIVAGALAGGPPVPLDRGMLCAVDLPRWPPTASGTLAFLLPARLLAMVGGAA